MKFYVDIADLGAIRRIAEFFPIEGFTTNPKILTKAPTPLPALMAEYREFVEQTGLTAFVQTTAETADGMLAQAKALQAYFGEHFVVKLPAVPEGWRWTATSLMSGREVLTNMRVSCGSCPWTAGAPERMRRPCATGW